MSHDADRARAAAQAYLLGAGLELLAVIVPELPGDPGLVAALAEELISLLERIDERLTMLLVKGVTYENSLTDARARAYLRQRLVHEATAPISDTTADEIYLTHARAWRRLAARLRS